MISEMVREHIRGLTDDALVDYLAAGPTHYEPEAIDFALEEAERRSLSLEYIEQRFAHQAESLQQANLIAAEEAAKPLGWEGKIIAFTFGLYWTLSIESWLSRIINPVDMTKRSEREARTFRLLGCAATVVLLAGVLTNRLTSGIVCASCIAAFAFLLMFQSNEPIETTGKNGLAKKDSNKNTSDKNRSSPERDG